MRNPDSIKPPRLAEKLFEWYSANSSVEDLRGDMEELFFLNLERMSVTRAKLQYWKQVVGLLCSYAIRKRKRNAMHHPFASTTFNPGMLKNYFLIAIRSLARHKLFTIINVSGLAIGMSISILLIAMLSFIWRYDTFHTNKDNIYRIISEMENINGSETLASAPEALGQLLKDNVAGIDHVVRIHSTLDAEATYGTREVPLQGYFVDPSFMEVFTFPLKKGNPITALDKLNSILITEKAAKKVFGLEDPFGKVITLDGLGECEITGVLKDHPKNSHMHFEILSSRETLLAMQRKNHGGQSLNTWVEFHDSYVYLLLPDEASMNNVERYLGKIAREVYSKESDFKGSFKLQALNDIVPGPDLHNSLGQSWGYASMGIFMVLTLLILIPACFNYANISIARALKRMKEIGVRKAMGGQKRQIFLQFILETVIIVFIGLGFSYFIFTIIRQEFIDMLVGGPEGIDLTPDFRTIICFVVFALIVGLGAGVIPALYFSKLNPIQALKSRSVGRKAARFSFRKTLVVLQFALSLGFIMSVVIIYNQYRQTLHYNFGFDQANILDVDLQGTNPDIFRNEFSKLSAVQSVSMSSHILGTEASAHTWVMRNDQHDSTEVFQIFVDDHYLDNLNLKLLAGKNFRAQASENVASIIVNEEFLKEFKIVNPIDVLGQDFLLADNQQVIVIGVVKNFHYAYLREPIKSFFFRYDASQFRVANIKVTSKDMFSTLSEMESIWKKFGPDTKLTAKFFDDEIEETYSFHFSMMKICGFLGILAISISCLGLLGMVVFTVENRIKEIGIRKVMGASTATITTLLSRDFTKLMLIAALIATPLTYLFFDKLYLRMQEYKMPIGISEIIISVLLMLILGLATILSQTVKAAKANPVDTLRSE